MEYFNLNGRLGVKICIGHTAKGRFCTLETERFIKTEQGNTQSRINRQLSEFGWSAESSPWRALLPLFPLRFWVKEKEWGVGHVRASYSPLSMSVSLSAAELKYMVVPGIIKTPHYSPNPSYFNWQSLWKIRESHSTSCECCCKFCHNGWFCVCCNLCSCFSARVCSGVVASRDHADNTYCVSGTIPSMSQSLISFPPNIIFSDSLGILHYTPQSHSFPRPSISVLHPRRIPQKKI